MATLYSDLRHPWKCSAIFKNAGSITDHKHVWMPWNGQITRYLYPTSSIHLSAKPLTRWRCRNTRTPNDRLRIDTLSVNYDAMFVQLFNSCASANFHSHRNQSFMRFLRKGLGECRQYSRRSLDK